MTVFELMWEYRAVAALLAIMAAGALLFVHAASQQDETWYENNGLQIKIGPETALVGILCIILLAIFFPDGVRFTIPGS